MGNIFQHFSQGTHITNKRNTNSKYTDREWPKNYVMTQVIISTQNALNRYPNPKFQFSLYVCNFFNFLLNLYKHFIK